MWNLALLSIDFSQIFSVFVSLLATIAGAALLYLLLFFVLRSLFRKFDRDIALVTLNVSAYPVLILFVLGSFRLTFLSLSDHITIAWLERLFTSGIVVAATYWVYQIFTQVVIYYLKDYAQDSEVMWDDVLLPLLEGAVPIVLFFLGGTILLQVALDIDLTGAWLTLGGATFVIGFAVRDILANFFSGIVLLLDSPFEFGDVLRLEDGSLGIITKIGVRVTGLYLTQDHAEIYIPNSVIQGKAIINMSRPIEPIYYHVPLELNSGCDLESAQKIIKEIVQAHPDTLGNLEKKLECLERFFDWDESYGDSFVEKKENGKERLIAENEVNLKLEEIEQSLEVLTTTLQFAEKGGLDQDDIATIQEEFNEILEQIGLRAETQQTRKKSLPFMQLKSAFLSVQLEEIQSDESLIGLVREWYRIWLRDPNIVDRDQYVLPSIWEYKIKVLTRRTQRLYQSILNPTDQETRIDDRVRDLVKWLRDRFKQARSQWHDPKVRVKSIVHDEGFCYVRMVVNYYVDDARLEDAERGLRVGSEIHREILRHLKESCFSHLTDHDPS
ncbi:MAG: mechanosensitive ion channel family protein [Prochlorotrichaceae cyanobacterium]|jgi:MscS family membrane protein